MLGEKDRSFSTARWTQVESFAQKRPEVVMSALGGGTADTRDALEIVTARREPVAELLDTLKAVSTVGGRVLLLVVLAEVFEVSLEYSMELVAATGNVPVRCHGRDRDCRTHINIYGRNELPASDTWFFHRSPHNVAHSPDAFSSLRCCEGAGDARRSPDRVEKQLPS